jgi:hypothetical protein
VERDITFTLITPTGSARQESTWREEAGEELGFLRRALQASRPSSKRSLVRRRRRDSREKKEEANDSSKAID